MDRRDRRSTSVTTTVSVPLTASPRSTLALDLEALYRTARDDVYAYVATLLHDRAAAEDVTAQAFEKAFRRRRSFDARRGSERAWLFGIARNAALDELRRRRRTTALTVDPAGPEAKTATTDDDPRGAVVRAALAALDAPERELVALKFHAGLSNAEIAALLGVSETNAGTRVHRAVTKLREACA